MDSNTEFKINQARQFLQGHRLQDAKRILEEIQETETTDPEIWHMLCTVHGMLGEFPIAERYARHLVEIRPDMPAGHTVLSQILLHLGRIDEAVASIQKSLCLDPDQPQSKLILGDLLREKKDFSAAESAYREAIRLDPNYADAHCNLAVTQQQTGKREEALANYRQAVQLNPDNMTYLYNLACMLRETGHVDDAEKTFMTVLQNQTDHAESHFGLGVIHKAKGRHDAALSHFKQALAINPNLEAAKRHLTIASSQSIPGWHFPMMNDEVRNNAYDDALRKVVTPDSIVLDIGSGSGLLAMMAARAGARHVYSCEQNCALAEKAREIVAINGYSDAITIINKKSNDLVIGTDMAERADILVSEILDECLLGEGVLPSVYHARQHLLKENAFVIPHSATIYAALVESEQLYKYYCVDKACGFDVKAFNALSRAPYTILRLSTFHSRILGDAVKAFHFDLKNPDPDAVGDKLFSVPINQDCTCHAVVFWFRLELDSQIQVESSPYSDSHWMQAAHIPCPPLELKAGDSVNLRGKYDSVSVRFTIKA